MSPSLQGPCWGPRSRPGPDLKMRESRPRKRWVPASQAHRWGPEPTSGGGGLGRTVSLCPQACESGEPACQCRRHGFDPWVGKIPQRRKWQPTPVLLPGESHGLRSLAGCSPWGRQESDTTEGQNHHHNGVEREKESYRWRQKCGPVRSAALRRGPRWGALLCWGDSAHPKFLPGRLQASQTAGCGSTVRVEAGDGPARTAAAETGDTSCSPGAAGQQSPEEGQGPAEESRGRAPDKGCGGRKGQPPPVRATSPLP